MKERKQKNNIVKNSEIFAFATICLFDLTIIEINSKGS